MLNKGSFVDKYFDGNKNFISKELNKETGKTYFK